MTSITAPLLDNGNFLWPYYREPFILVGHTPMPSDTPRYALHVICKQTDSRFTGLTAIDSRSGEYRSDDWHIKNGNPLDLLGGWLYFHDSSTLRSTFSARILEVIPTKTMRARVAFRVRRITTPTVNWRGKKARRDDNGGVVPALFDHEVTDS